MISLMVVDLPAPFGPTNAVTSPGRTTNDSPSTATVERYCLRRPRTSIDGVMAVTLGGAGGYVVAPRSGLPIPATSDPRPSRQGWLTR